MGLDLLCAFLFAVILFVLVNFNNRKFHVIDSRETKESFDISGDFEDYKYGDIKTADGPDELVSSCDYFVHEPKLFKKGTQWDALRGHGINPYELVYSDYRTTQDEAMNATFGPRIIPDYAVGPKIPFRSFEVSD